MAFKLIRALRSVQLSYDQRRSLSETFIMSLATYALYAQPWPAAIEEETQKLERLLLGWIFRVRTNGVY